MSVSPTPSPSPGERGAPYVLILDDDPTVRRFLAEIVQEALPQSTLAVVADGESALDLIEQAPFDLAFIDLALPGSSVSGVLVCQALCRDLRTRIVVVSGLTSPAVREACEAMGIAGYLRKPVSAAQVRAHLEAWSPTDAADAPIPVLSLR